VQNHSGTVTGPNTTNKNSKNYYECPSPCILFNALLMMASSLATRADLLTNNFWVNPFFELAVTSTKLTAQSQIGIVAAVIPPSAR